MALFADHYITLGDKRVALRPTLEAIHAIEAQTGLGTLSLIALLHARKLPPAMLRIIAHEGARAADGVLEDASDESLQQAAPALCEFLLSGIGCEATADALDVALFRSLRQPDWQDMFKTYVGMMGHSVQEFRQLTYSQYLLAVEGFCMLHGVEPSATAAPATSRDLREMLQRFPD